MANGKKGGITRRIALVGGIAVGGGMVLGAAFIRPWGRLAEQRTMIAKEGETPLLGSVRISNDGIVTAIVPHADMGVGNGTALAQMLGEELDADWSQMRFERAPAEMAFANWAMAQAFLRGDTEIPAALAGVSKFAFRKIAENMRIQITGGSLAVRSTGIDGMRMAGAAVREMLVRAAAKEWKIASDEIAVKDGRISHPSGKEAGFGAFAEAALAFKPSTKPKLKDPKTYSICGRPKQRFDIPAKVDGSAIYGPDVRLPGMVYAAIRVSPVHTGRLVSVDKGPALAVRGVEDVIELSDAVAVTADSYWRAQQGVNALSPQWAAGENAAFSSAQTIEDMKAGLSQNDLKKDYSVGNANGVIAAAEDVVAQTYEVPFLAHAAMEPVGCVAHFEGENLTIHGAFQDALNAKFQAMDFSGLGEDQVKIVHTELGGAFGRRGSTLNFLKHAIEIAQQAQKPVSLLYSREEDMTQDYYRNASVAALKATLDDDGKPAAITYIFAEKDDPVEASRFPYDIPNVEAKYIQGVNKFPWGPWRSVDHSIHGFFIESFIDELAHKAGADPFRYRQSLLAHDNRRRRVLDVAAKMASWGGQTLGPRTGIGIALVESFNTIVAESAKVHVTEDGEIQVKNVWIAADPGEIVNPDGFARQMESGAIYGLTAALYGEITFENGEVQQLNFPDYPMMTLGDCPQIEVELLTSNVRVGGAGEPGTPPVAPAVANAIFAATGQRIRTLPFSKTDLSLSATAA